MSVCTNVTKLRRLGGNFAAALFLWWLFEGSNNGFDIEHADVDFRVFILYYKMYIVGFENIDTGLQGLPTAVKVRFLQMADLIMANHPEDRYVKCDHLLCSVDQRPMHPIQEEEDEY